MTRTAAIVFVILVIGAGAMADFTNPSSLIIKETSPSHFTVELTLPVIQGRVLKARPILPDICMIEGDPDVRGDDFKIVRTWSMSCDPGELAGTAIGVHGLLGTTVDVQLTLETLDGRTYTGQLSPTRAYYLVPRSPTILGMAIEFGGAGARQALRHPELAVLFLLLVLCGVRLPGLIASALAFAAAVAVGQWLKTENWIGVSSFVPVVLTSALALATASSLVRDRFAGPTLRLLAALLSLAGVLYGAGGLRVEMTLSRGEQHLAYLLSGLGSLAGLALVILCARQLCAALDGFGEAVRLRIRFWVAYLVGVAACAIGLYHFTSPFFAGGMTPTVPMATLLGAVALGVWCGAQPAPTRAFVQGLVGCTVIAGTALGLREVFPPQTTLVLYGSLAFVGLLLARPLRLTRWAVLGIAAVFAFYQGAHAGGILRGGVALPTAQAAALVVLFIFHFLAAYHMTMRRGAGNNALRWFGVVTALAAVVWRIAEYRNWLEGDVAVDATMGLLRLPVLAIVLLIAALALWPRRRRFQPAGAKRIPAHWGLVLAALFVLPVGGFAVHNPFYTPRAPTAAEARPIMAMLLSDTYRAFNLPDENDAFDRLARNLSEDLVPDVYLDSRRRLTAGTREGADVTVKDVSVMSVDDPRAFDSGDGSFSYPCKWVVTARVKHWQHIHDRQNIYVGELTIRVENNRWKISRLELLSEEREIVSWKRS